MESAPYNFTFNDWEHERCPEESPLAGVLKRLPRPERARDYRPAWGKYSKAGEKACATRNYKRHLRNREIFLSAVLPTLLPLLDKESLHDIGIDFLIPDLIDKSEYSLWVKGDLASWVASGDPNELKAAEMGATKLTTGEAVAFMRARQEKAKNK